MEHKRWWVSWEEPITEDDYRPLHLPLPAAVRAWWCSGEGEDYANLCAVVDASTEVQAKEAIEVEWRPRRWRFCKEKEPMWRPGDRFPWPEGRGAKEANMSREKTESQEERDDRLEQLRLLQANQLARVVEEAVTMLVWPTSCQSAAPKDLAVAQCGWRILLALKPELP